MDTQPTTAGPFGFTFHQVAMFAPDGVADAVALYAELGFTDWTYDNAELHGSIRMSDSNWSHSVVGAKMAFNYSAMPMELEFLEYHGTGHRHEERARNTRIPFISHMSVHVDSVMETIARMKSDYVMSPYHIFVTNNHSNPGVRGKKRFVECIYDTRDWLGYDLKCIERVGWDSKVTAEGIIRDSLLGR